MKTTMPRPIHTLAVLLALALAADAARADIETRVDRSRLSVGESLNLLLRDRGGSAAPDLAPLQGDFEILDVRQSQRTSIVNGRRDQSVDWIVQLTPRRAGELTLPVVPVGRDASTPLTVTVTEHAAGATGTSGAPAWIEVEVDDEAPFVQGQVVLTARLFADASVRRGALELVAPEVLDENGLAASRPMPSGARCPTGPDDATSTTGSGAGGGGELPAGTLLGAAVALAAIGGTVTVVRRRRLFVGVSRGVAATVGRPDTISLGRAQGALRSACAVDDPHRAAEALVAIGRARWPDASPAGAGAVVRAIGDRGLIVAVDELQRSVYAPDASTPWQGVTLWRAWQAARRGQQARVRRRRREILPPLYPRW